MKCFEFKVKFYKKCSQTLARPALYRHSFHREFGFSDTKPTWRGLQGLEPFVVLSFYTKQKISNCHFKPFLKAAKQLANINLSCHFE